MPEVPHLPGLALDGLILIGTLALLVWGASAWRRDASLVDRFWSVFIAGAAAVYFVRGPVPTPRGIAMLALALVWALRLCLYVTRRNWGHGEDRRYAQIRARHQPHFVLKSLYLVFALQAVLAWLVSAPFLIGMTGARAWGALDLIGISVAVFGVVFEAVADGQMARFKGDPAHRGTVMDQGLWAWTRHPNYFGEACVWWGLWLLALSAAGSTGAWSVVSPLLMTFLLLKVSGVRLLEQDIVERRPAYRDYIARTNAFVPGPRRRRSTP